MSIDAERAKSLFLAASDIADAAERAAYLDRECGGDADLRARVDALLKANDERAAARKRRRGPRRRPRRDSSLWRSRQFRRPDHRRSLQAGGGDR